MEKKRKKINVKFIVLIISLVVFLSVSVLTFAFFTDSKSYNGNLTFGELKLKVSGDSVTQNSQTLLFDTARKFYNDSTWTGKYMPGDTINIKLKVGLEDGSEPAYYLVQISDNKNVFENAFYYSQDGTNIYVNNGQKIYKQGTTTAVTTPIIGKILSAGDSNAHSLTISAKISEDFESQGVVTTVYCNIYAVQRANLEEKSALSELLIGASEDKKVYTKLNYLESTGTQWIDTKYVYKTEPKIEMEFNPTMAKDMFLAGVRVDNGVNSKFVYNPTMTNASGNGAANYMYGEASWKKMPSTSLKLNEWIKISFGKIYKENDKVINTITETYDFSTNTFPIYLFHANGGGQQYGSGVKMKYCDIFDGDVLVRELIPVLRNSDNKPGMFDALSGIFYTNVGSGEFVYA